MYAIRSYYGILIQAAQMGQKIRFPVAVNQKAVDPVADDFRISTGIVDQHRQAGSHCLQNGVRNNFV